MKKAIIIISTLFFLAFSIVAFAHPPLDIIFNYDSKNKVLSVGILHPVEDLQKHFIKKINIKVNGKDWIAQNFSNQIKLEAQAASFAVVDLKKGDIIEVLAICNQSGQLKKTFKIE